MMNRSYRMGLAVLLVPLLLPLVLSACVVRTPESGSPTPTPGRSSGNPGGEGTNKGSKSAASELVTVPDLSDRSRGFARDVLRQLDLRVGSTSYRADDRRRGLVVHTDPEAGDQVRPGSRIDLVVSSGPGDTDPQRVEVPNLFGQDELTAREELRSRGLKVEVNPRPVADAQSGTVLEQQPEKGTRVAPGATVTLVVAAPAGASPTASPTALPTEG